MRLALRSALRTAAERIVGSSARGLTALALVLVAVVCMPVLTVVAKVGADTEGLWSHLAATVLPRYLWNTLWLVLGVGGLTFLLGVSTAWLVTLTSFPGRRFFVWALLLPLAVPSYLGAYAYTDLLQYTGPIQSALRAGFGWTTASDYWFPHIRSLPGAVLILSLALYPYVYLAARTAFLEQSVCALEVARTLGAGPLAAFLRVGLPLAWPSIVAGLSLVLMETLAEFGAVQYFAVDTFATGIYRTFLLPGRHALTASAQLSACLLFFILLLLTLEAAARRSARFHHMSTRYRPLPTPIVGGVVGRLAAVWCSVPIVLGFVVPIAIFFGRAVEAGDRRAGEMFVEIGTNSLTVAAIASSLAVVLALVIGFADRSAGSPLSGLLARVAGLGYAIPGGVIAIGIVIAVTSVDRLLSDLGSRLFGWEAALLLSGTIVATIYGYLTRFLAVAIGLVQGGYSRIRASVDGAARTLGCRPARLLLRIHAPLLRGTLLSAGLLVFVDVIKELPATLILRPFGFETLAVRVYQLASDERLDEASTGALAIVLLGLIPIVLLSRMLERARPGSRAAAGRPAP